jgi:hypothetical protein
MAKRFLLRRLGVEYGQTLNGGNLTERVVSDDELLKEALAPQVESHRELERVQRSQTMREAVSSNQALGCREVILRDGVHFNIT